MIAATNNASATNTWLSASSTPETEASQLNGACALLAMLVKTQCTNQSSIKGDIKHGFERLEDLKKQLAESVRQAEEAASNSGLFGFLGDIFGSDIAQIAGAVAAIAATIGSGGAAAPLILIAISQALQVAAKVGAELGLDPKICMGIAIASVAVGFCGGGSPGQVTGEVGDVARKVALGAKITQGSATAVGGSLQIVSAHYRAEQLDCQADAVNHQAQEDTTDLALDDALARLEHALRTEQHETTAASQIVGDTSDTDISLCNRI